MCLYCNQVMIVFKAYPCFSQNSQGSRFNFPKSIHVHGTRNVCIMSPTCTCMHKYLMFGGLALDLEHLDLDFEHPCVPDACWCQALLYNDYYSSLYLIS